MMDRGDTDPRAVKHSDDVKERAYQLWAFVASRRVALVSDLLASGEYGDPAEVSSRTVKRWEHEHAWPQRVQDDLRAIAPDIREQTITELIFGALDGARYLRAVINGSDPKPSKERVAASLGVLDKAGLSHTGTRADPIASVTAAQPIATYALDYATVSDDDLEHLERQLAEQAKRPTARIPGRR